jgi:hypothetical protein
MTQPNRFAAFKPFEAPNEQVADAEIENFAAERGVPTLVREAPPAETEADDMPEFQDLSEMTDAMGAGDEEAPAEPARRGKKAKAVPGRQPIPRSQMQRVTIELPRYVVNQLKTRGLKQNCSVRAVIMKSLKANGIPIDPADMVDDARRTKK